MLVGFSQGTMMALHVGLRRAAPLAGIVGFSGRLLEPERLAAEIGAAPAGAARPRRRSDPVVPFASLGEAADALAAAGVETDTHVSRGVGHGIAPDGLGLALSFIRERLGIAEAGAGALPGDPLESVADVTRRRAGDLWLPCGRGKCSLSRGLPAGPAEM